MNRRTPLATALLSVFASPIPLLAQETPPPTLLMASTAVEAVVIQGAKNSFAPGPISLSKLPADLHNVAQQVTIVNKALM